MRRLLSPTPRRLGHYRRSALRWTGPRRIWARLRRSWTSGWPATSARWRCWAGERRAVQAVAVARRNWTLTRSLWRPTRSPSRRWRRRCGRAGPGQSGGQGAGGLSCVLAPGWQRFPPAVGSAHVSRSRALAAGCWLAAELSTLPGWASLAAAGAGPRIGGRAVRAGQGAQCRSGAARCLPQAGGQAGATFIFCLYRAEGVSAPLLPRQARGANSTAEAVLTLCRVAIAVHHSGLPTGVPPDRARLVPLPCRCAPCAGSSSWRALWATRLQPSRMRRGGAAPREPGRLRSRWVVRPGTAHRRRCRRACRWLLVTAGSTPAS